MRNYYIFVFLFFLIIPIKAQEKSFLDLYAQYLSFYGAEKLYDTNIQEIKGNENRILKYDSKTFKLYKDSINTHAIQRVSIEFTENMDLQEVFNDLAIFPNLFYLKLENIKFFGDPIQVDFPKDLSGISGVNFINFYGRFSWDFNGIFDQLRELENLRYLALINFGEDEEIAANIGLLSSLEGLSLSGRYGAGIPNSVSELKNLKSLALSADLFPDFHDQVQKFKNNPQLKEIYLNSFKLEEEDYPVFKEFTSIERLELRNVEINDLDEFLGNTSGNRNLKHLVVFGTKTSNFSTGLNSFEKLEYLRLERVGEDIEVPQQVYNLNNLEKLIISDNETFQSLDIAIKNLNNLKELSIYFTSLKQIPAEIGELVNLEELNLKRNKIEKLPDEISSLTSLTKFYINHNHLGMLPAEIGNLKNLQELHLHRNLLKYLPASFSNLKALELVHLEENDLKKLPEDFGKLSSLEILDLSKNLLQELPKSFGNLSRLRTVRLDNNDLKELPKNIGQLTNLERISFNNHYNDFISSYDLETREIVKDTTRIERKHNRIKYLPVGFSQLEHLKFIRLENNPIDGRAFFNILKDLKSKEYYVDLKNCGIDDLPATGWDNILVESLSLSNNQISVLPSNIMNAPYLRTLDLSNNPIGELSRYYSRKEQLIIAFYEAGFIDRSDLPANEGIAEALLNIGYNKKDRSKRLEFFEHAFEVDAQFTDSRIRASDYAETLANAGNFEKAIKYYDRAIERDTARGPYVLNFIHPNFRNRAKAHLAVGDTLAAIKGLAYVSQRFNSGDWAEAALLARAIEEDSLAADYFSEGEKFYKKYIQHNLEAGQVDFGYQLSLLELYIIKEDLPAAQDYLDYLKKEQIQQKDKQLLLRYLEQVLKILQDKAKESELQSFRHEVQITETQISSWSFELIYSWLDLNNMEKIKINRIKELTKAMENKK
ncbi:hypothetical protein FHG64_11070 [Antarcticibacterium flavum]|uniref:Disease resistance R13L4/SHOC-2-like LRR domain-containing protein n=1 Tax=Antarcticibacterium flavum TaxID=2058175 RepID=A0A5B7X311_9FLAO|nr:MULTISPECIES: hypothetical protein [Antarcticibacterium]QCY69896.1 hypothetical protein FHG64_11070 [Antarcticibacterium flavum]